MADAWRVIVARGRHADWVWEAWSVPDLPVCLDLGEAVTVEEAMADADRVTAGYVAVEDAELIARNGLGWDYGGVVLLEVVMVGEGKRCVLCGVALPLAWRPRRRARTGRCGADRARAATPGPSWRARWPQLPEHASWEPGNGGTGPAEGPMRGFPPG
jgi:predicted RNase H-like HicB family nuclease